MQSIRLTKKLFKLNSFKFGRNLATGDEQEKIVSTTNRKKYSKPPPIDLKSVRTNRQEQDEREKQSTSTGKINAMALLTIPLVTFGLGVWQIKRRETKLEMIKFLEDRTKSHPIELPENPKEIETLVQDHEYQRIRVKGRFLHSKEIILTIRHDSTGMVSGPGGHVITPFLVSNRKDGLTILVNRGFVPYTHYSPTRRSHAQIDGEVELIGLLRGNELTSTFTPVNNPPSEWHYRDVNQMAFELNTAPIFLDADYDSTIRGGPIGGQTNVKLKNDHLTYLVTWFSLSILTSILWWKRYSRVLF